MQNVSLPPSLSFHHRPCLHALTVKCMAIWWSQMRGREREISEVNWVWMCFLRGAERWDGDIFQPKTASRHNVVYSYLCVCVCVCCTSIIFHSYNHQKWLNITWWNVLKSNKNMSTSLWICVIVCSISGSTCARSWARHWTSDRFGCPGGARCAIGENETSRVKRSEIKINVGISSKSLTKIDQVIETVSESLMLLQSKLKGKICQYLIK